MLTRLRPAARRRAMTFRPFFVALRFRNPCFRCRFLRWGWYVRFMTPSYVDKQSGYPTLLRGGESTPSNRNIIMKTADHWIDRLGLAPHPEGGFFRENYRSRLAIPADALPPAYAGARSAGTSIYFLLKGGDFPSFHRLRSDEI